MYSIKSATIRRMTQINGTPCAEIEVHPSSETDTVILAYLAPSAPIGGYELVKVVRSNASLEHDWFDNCMHTAFEDATDVAFENITIGTAEEERDQFKQQLLSHGTLKQQLNERFYEGNAP
ncbi:hypothetical protein [Paenibacillus faecalis]|uniref:hypothetical protein n=1 Tax=Paenibacillus faecalis TaxID=2079532 RepID=UPI000D108047|nr:hypothetical protein [Paenibacillus faecalis]